MEPPEFARSDSGFSSGSSDLRERIELLGAQIESLSKQVASLHGIISDTLFDPVAWRKLERFFADNLIQTPLFSPKEVNIILSHPKTGGNALYYAAERARENVACAMHTHYMSPPATQFVTDAIVSRLQGQFSAQDEQDIRNLYWHAEHNGQLAEYARHWVQKHVPLPLDPPLADSHFAKKRRADLPRTNIIVGVREPLACCLSGYFQVMADTSAKAIPNETVKVDLLRLLKRTHPVNQFHWWRNQIQLFFGRDLLSEEFDRARGWHLYHFRNISFLVIKQEAFEQVPTAMAALFGMPKELITIEHENAAADKEEVSQLYQRAKTGLRFDRATLDQIYENRWFKHFYTEEEEAAFRERWQE
jgi:hypothetical protein